MFVATLRFFVLPNGSRAVSNNQKHKIKFEFYTYDILKIKNCEVHKKQKTIPYWKIWENPLPESCAMLFTTRCTGRILKKRAGKLVFLQKYKKSKIGKKHVYISPSYERYGEILFQKVASGYLLHFVQDGSSKNALEK